MACLSVVLLPPLLTRSPVSGSNTYSLFTMSAPDILESTHTYTTTLKNSIFVLQKRMFINTKK